MGAVVAWVLVASGISVPFWLVFAFTTGITTGTLAVTDRDGWTIRNALAYVALAQRGRWRVGSLPRTASEAATWLDDPVNANATHLQRAAMLFSAGRWEDARALLERVVPSTDVERASLVRMRATINGQASGHVDLDQVREAVRTLEPAEAKYQLVAAAWSQAWLDISAGRPWRKRFANAVKQFEPFDVPGRFRAWIAIQQLAAPIACVLASLIFGMITLL